jgi:hypothetical protein
MPDDLWIVARFLPQHDPVVEEIGALAHDRVVIAVQRVDHDLEGFLAELLGHLGTAGMQEARCPRGRGILMLCRQDGLVEPVDRISHARTIACKS